jgi:hypothetical protein
MWSQSLHERPFILALIGMEFMIKSSPVKTHKAFVVGSHNLDDHTPVANEKFGDKSCENKQISHITFIRDENLIEISNDRSRNH